MTFAEKLMKVIWWKAAGTLEERTRRRVVVHLIPYLFFLYILAYLDRVNVSVAKFGMEKGIDEGGLGFTDQIIGFGFGIFFWGYWILEIPSTLSVLKWGARWVFVRILILWGLACTLIGLIGTPTGNSMFGWLAGPVGDSMFQSLGWVATNVTRTPPGPLEDFNLRQFYFLRFMLGFFEGGFFPSVILYLTLWFPARHRAKAIATFMAAIPISSMLGSPISGMMLNIGWLDMPGWRWIFILQGIVPILAGFLTIFFLPDRPEQADWLPPDERDFLVGELTQEGRARIKHGHWDWLPQIGTVLLFTVYYFGMNVTNYGLATFMPSVIKSQSGLSAKWASILAGLPYLMALLGMLVNAVHSDRSQERVFHVALPLMGLSGGLFLAAATDGMPVLPVLCMIFLVGTFMYAHLPPFWPLPSIFLGAAAAASAIGFINMIGNFGGFFGPAWVGELSRGQTSFKDGLLRIAPYPLVSAAVILLVGFIRRKKLSAARNP